MGNSQKLTKCKMQNAMQQLLCYVGLAKHLPDTGERSLECVKEDISLQFDNPILFIVNMT